MDIPVVELHDGELILRRMRESDQEAVFKVCQDERMREFTAVPDDYTMEMAKEFVSRHDAIRWALSNAEGDYLGNIELRDVGHKTVSVGYSSAPWARGKGYQTRALKLVIAHAFKCGVHRVEVKARPDNAASRWVAESAGCIYEGVLRDAEYLKGAHHDLALYSALSTDENWV